MKPDWIKIRVDDTLGTTQKMPPEVYRAVIDEAHKRGLRVAAHIFYLADAKDLVASGVDMIAHSVRDAPIDAAFVPISRGARRLHLPHADARGLGVRLRRRARLLRRSLLPEGRGPGRAGGAAHARAARARARQPATRPLPRGARDGEPRTSRRWPTRACRSRSAPTPARPRASRATSSTWSCELMVEAGLTPTQALVAATGGTARCLGLKSVGTSRARGLGRLPGAARRPAAPTSATPGQPRVGLDRRQPRPGATRHP